MEVCRGDGKRKGLTLGGILRLGRAQGHCASGGGQEAHDRGGDVLRIHGDAGEGDLGVEHDVLDEGARLLEEAVLGGVWLGALVLLDGLDEAVLGYRRADDPVHGQALAVLRLGELRVGRAQGVARGGIAHAPVLEEGLVVGQALADLGEVDDGLDTGLLEIGRGADARQLEEMGGAEGTGGGDDIFGRDDGAVGQFNAGGPGRRACSVEDDLVDHGVEAHLDSLEGVEARRPLALPIVPGLADVGAAQVVASVLVEVGEGLNTKVLPGSGGLLAQREDAAGGAGGCDMDGAVLAVLRRVLVVEPVLGLLEVGELALIAVSLVADKLRPLVKVNGGTASPTAYVDPKKTGSRSAFFFFFFFYFLVSDACMCRMDRHVITPRRLRAKTLTRVDR